MAGFKSAESAGVSPEWKLEDAMGRYRELVRRVREPAAAIPAKATAMVPPSAGIRPTGPAYSKINLGDLLAEAPEHRPEQENRSAK